MRFGFVLRGAACATLLLGAPGPSAGQAPAPSPDQPGIADRGAGVATSMFGTYVSRGELIVYPFFEHYHDRDFEYAPEELGADGDADFRGRYRAHEGLLFLAFGLHDDVAVEFEAAVITASLEKAAGDRSALPARVTESGIGDLEAQVRWRWRRETASRPELFSFSEIVFPHHGERRLIGTPGWEIKAGAGATRGFRWGTLTVRAAVEYSEASTSPVDLGEYAVEYLKRLSPRWRVYVGVEGAQDELALIAEAQWHVRRGVFVKINNGVGLTSKATDWAPEIGVVFTLPVR